MKKSVIIIATLAIVAGCANVPDEQLVAEYQAKVESLSDTLKTRMQTVAQDTTMTADEIDAAQEAIYDEISGQVKDEAVEAISKHPSGKVAIAALKDVYYMLDSDELEELISKLKGDNLEDEFVQKVKAGNVKSAIWEEGTLWLLLLTGIIFALAKTGIAPWIPQTPALVLLIIAVLLLLFGAGRDAKGFGKVTAAFSCIYNTATGWFGDILSYSRIMALMLAGGVVGQVFNTVALMPMKNSGPNVITILAFIIIFILGHAMNFGLNLLGCYVHDLRLQCLEFLGKFYQDGGKPFEPMRVKGKYINVKQ